MLISICKNGIGSPRILALAPDTPGLPALDATAEGGELDSMRNDIAGIHVDALIGTVPLTGRNSLADALRDGNYDVLHLITHGDCEHAQLTREAVSWQAVARLLSQHHVRLVLAMTCDSRPFADGLIAAGTPQVICTSGKITNDDARLFAREFYGALARSLRVNEAVSFARSRMSADGAALVHLLPDDDAVADVDPLVARLRQLQQDQAEWRAEVRKMFGVLDEKFSKRFTHQDDMMRSLTAAIVHLAEVLAK